MNLDEVIDSFWESTQQGVYFPPEWRGKLSLEQGYRVQLGLLDRFLKNGEAQAGWKVGLTSKPIQQQLELFEPVFGFLLESGNRPAGTVIAYDELLAPCFEVELCLTLGKDLQGPGVSTEQARAAISAAQPALEIVERRGDLSADLALAMADNAQQKFFVTGDGEPLREGVDLKAVAVQVVVNGEQVDEAIGQNVMGDPAASVAWLANRLATFGRTLAAGARIMSGSFAKQHAIAQGDLVEAHFSPFGTVMAEFQ